jgi:hypothetical protein
MVCWRMSPLLLVALVALRARWLAGLITNSVGRTAAPVASSAPTATLSSALSSTLSALRGYSGAVSQFFVWFYLVLGAVLCLTLVSRALNSVIDEIKLQRECSRPPRHPATRSIRPPR